MSFWERVVEILERKGINKKELAAAAKIDASTISKGLVNKNTPSAEKAVLIAQFLNTTVEYLVTGSNSINREINRLYERKDLIDDFDKIPYDAQQSIGLMISDLSSKYTPSK